DTDLAREDPTAPGGLQLYGRVAALAAGEARRFEDFYSLLENVDWTSDPPRGQRRYDRASSPFGYLDESVRRTEPQTIVWDFRHPTQWEHVLAGRLEAAGGTRVPIDTPSLADRAARPPEQTLSSIQIRTPRTAWPKTLEVLTGMLGVGLPNPGCATLA